MIIKTQLDVTAAVLAELQRADDPRFKQMMTVAVRHLHESSGVKHASIERRATASETFDRVAARRSEVAAGVRQVVERSAKDHAGMRVLEPNFMTIKQAMGTPAGPA